ncbi:hypothetical protein D3C73_1460590 [compost metagenome]
MPSNEVDGIVLPGIYDVDPSGVVEPGARGLIRREGDLDGIVGIYFVAGRLAALDGGKIDEMT